MGATRKTASCKRARTFHKISGYNYSAYYDPVAISGHNLRKCCRKRKAQQFSHCKIRTYSHNILVPLTDNIQK